MIRTRDVVIFIAILMFVCAGIALTLVFDARMNMRDVSFVPYFEVATNTNFVAEAPDQNFNRESIIERLRGALGSLEREVEPEPSVEESPSTVSDDPSENPKIPLGVVSCGGDDTQQLSQIWPSTGISVGVAGSMRTVSYTDPAASAVTNSQSSSTASTSTLSAPQKTLLSIPTTPLLNAAASCVPGDIIGVTLSGMLMHNSDAAFYTGYGAEFLIGYARDGFPIYGYYEGIVDECGGYAHPSGYRYTISPDRSYVLGCFMGTPAHFTP